MSRLNILCHRRALLPRPRHPIRHSAACVLPSMLPSIVHHAREERAAALAGAARPLSAAPEIK